MMYLALPVRSNGQLVGYVRTALPLSVIDERISQLRAIIAVGAGSAVLVALLLGLVFARRFSAPLTAMTSVAEAMAQGDYDQKLSITRSDEIGKLAGALNQMAESARDRMSELHRLEQIRRDFVANVSHELKTPIAAVRGLVETVIDDRKMTDEDRERFLAKIRNQSMRLSSIVTDLLTLSQLESGNGMLETGLLDLCEVVRSTVTSLAQTAEARNIRVEVRLPEDPVRLLGDEDALSQVISNLLDNALKYSPRDAAVWIRLRKENGKAVIEIQDRGVGIEPRDRDRIFERFYRVDKARSRELGGTGLGLSIVKHIVLAHGGAVDVESSPGAGSTFRVLLPVENSA